MIAIITDNIKNMKIGFDGKRAVQNFTGLGNYSRYLIEILNKCFAGNEYILYAPKMQDSFQFEQFTKVCPNLECVYPEKPWNKLKALWRSVRVTGLLERDGIDIYHGLSNELPFNIRKARSVKSVVTIHDLIFLHYPQYYPRIDRLIYAYKFKKACKDASAIVAVSECTKRDIIRFYHVPENKIHVIYQGCDDSFMREVRMEDKQRVRERYALPERYILNVGSIEERKNILLVIKALNELPEEIHLVIVGRKTQYTENAIDYIKSHSLEKRVHFRHHVTFDDLPSIYQYAKLFVYPSKYEGFGIPVIEALHSGIPVIAATGSCLEEAGGPGSCYVSPDDEQEMADAIRSIWYDPDLQQRMIEQGKQYVSRFSAEKQAAQMMELYQTLTKCNSK